MGIKLCCWLLAVCMSLFWTVLTLMFLMKIYSQASFLQVHQNMRISNVRYPTQCLDKYFYSGYHHPIVFSCHLQNNNQYFYLTKEKQIRRDNMCLSYNNQRRQFVSGKCKHIPGTWTYSQDNLIMLEGTGLCVTMVNQTTIDMAACDSSDTSQQWNWSRQSITLP